MPVNPACEPALLAAPGMVALYLLDEATAAPGDTVSDSVGTHHGVVTNNGAGVITPQQDPLACDGGKCFAFDQDFVTVAAGIPALDAASEFTFFAWVRKSADPNLDFAICDRRTVSGFGSGGAALFINDDYELSLAVYDGTSPDEEVVESTVLVPPDTLAFCAGTWDGSTAKVYVNGQPAGSLATTQTPPTASRPFLIGFDTVQPSSSLGRIDNVGVCTQALSDAEIAALYAACRCARQHSRSQLVA